MAKKKKSDEPTQEMPQYKVGDEFIYTNERDTMQRVSIIAITPTGYKLSNQVVVDRSLKRTDDPKGRYSCIIYPADERHLQMLEAYGAYFALKRAMADLRDQLEDLDEYHLTRDQAERIIRINRKLQKAIKE